jgi:methanogenic corrinoid protein MtbC1
MNAVVRETGVLANTLRAWERRYKMPMPERSEGGQRRYSSEDVLTVKWLAARKEEGLSISRAVEILREMKSNGINPLENQELVLKSEEDKNGISNDVHSAQDYRQRWVQACLDFDEASAEQTIRQALSIFDVQTVCVDVFSGGLREIGEKWYEGKLIVQQEHFASNLAIRKLNTLIAATDETSHKKKVVIATPSSEKHTISALILTLLLRRRGIRVVYLGAETPLVGINIMISVIRPDLVVYSSSRLGSLAELMKIANYLAEAEIPMAYGGRIFNLYSEVRNTIPGYLLGNSLADSRETIESLLDSNLAPAKPKLVAPKYDKALKKYLDLQSDVESEVSAGLGKSTNTLNFYHEFISDNISAAMALGMTEPIASEIDWAVKFSEIHEVDRPNFRRYVEAYTVAIEKLLGAEGLPISEWLSKVEEKISA